MKFKKIISAVSAFAMAMSLVPVANAASLGGKPVVTAEFVEYTTNTNMTWAKAWVKVTIDMSAAEELAAYKNEIVFDEDEEDDVAKETGNGITTMGGVFAVSNTSDFAVQSTKNEKPDALNLKVNTADYTLSFGPKDNPVEYYVNEKSEILLNFKTTNFDAKADFNISSFTIDGKYVDVYNAVSNSEVWAYAQSNGSITVAGCSIPSYNEWSTPTTTPEPTPDPTPAPTPDPTPVPQPTVTMVPATPVANAEVGSGERLDAESASAFAFWAEYAFSGADTAFWTATIGTDNKMLNRNVAPGVEGPAKLGLIITGADSVTNVALKVITPAN